MNSPVFSIHWRRQEAAAPTGTTFGLPDAPSVSGSNKGQSDYHYLQIFHGSKPENLERTKLRKRLVSAVPMAA
jgi:hypothetical protein